MIGKLEGGVVLVALALLGVAGVWLYRQSPAIAAAADKINPLNPDNIFATTVNDVGAAVSGNQSFSLGTWAWEVVNPSAAAKEKALTAPVTPSSPAPLSSWDQYGVPTF
jgi:hypothetical protein